MKGKLKIEIEFDHNWFCPGDLELFEEADEDARRLWLWNQYVLHVQEKDLQIEYEEK